MKNDTLTLPYQSWSNDRIGYSVTVQCLGVISALLNTRVALRAFMSYYTNAVILLTFWESIPRTGKQHNPDSVMLHGAAKFQREEGDDPYPSETRRSTGSMRSASGTRIHAPARPLELFPAIQIAFSGIRSSARAYWKFLKCGARARWKLLKFHIWRISSALVHYS